MSTRKITGIIEDIRTKLESHLRKIDPRNIKKIAAMTSIMVVLPLAVQAASSEQHTVEPLTPEQSQKLAKNIAQLTPTAKKDPEPIKIEVAPDPQPQPAPEPPAPAPEPAPAPARVARRVATTRTTARRSSSGKAVVGNSYEQCVPFARELSGVQVRGYAGNIRPNSQEASVGSVALFAGYGHAAVVTGVNGDSVTIKEANYVPGKITERTVPKSQLRGYVK